MADTDRSSAINVCLIEPSESFPPFRQEREKDGAPHGVVVLNLTRYRFLFCVFQDAEGRVHHLLVHSPILSRRFGQWDGNDVVSAQGRHSPKLAAMHHIYRAQAIACRQNTLERSRGSTALNRA